tara:strand:- start:2798 stop:3484 length:687 start_codon:yes stop_codon:yes gene_type:complete
MSSPLIVALDLEPKEAMDLAKKLDPEDCKLKVGSKLFTSSGPSIVNSLNDMGFKIFLDLKFHDIPNTVYGAIQEACKLNVWMTNVHCSGGLEMIKSAKKSMLENSESTKTIVVGVTLLTSIGPTEAKKIGINSVKNQTIELARLAKEGGLDGVVCSPQEVKNIKQNIGREFLTVTPGIRRRSSKGDQKRISTAQEAVKNGSDYLVIGRPITESKNPVKSIKSLLKEVL